MTCGEDIGNAGKNNADLCRMVGLNYCGTMPIIMPENYIAMFTVPNENESAKIIEQAQPILRNAVKMIQNNVHFTQQKLHLADRLKSSVINKAFYRFFVKASPFYVTNACINCGWCEQACPMNNIQLVQSQPQWGKTCTHCMSCICGCPSEAIEYGKKSIGQIRYHCIEYQSNNN